MNYRIKCSKCPPLADTHACSHLQCSFIELLIAFSSGEPNQLKCIFKLGNRFWLPLQLVKEKL